MCFISYLWLVFPRLFSRSHLAAFQTGISVPQTNSTSAFPKSTGLRRVQTTGSTGHTKKIQLKTPRTQNAAATAKAQKKWPVLSKMKPVTAEAIAPEVFPKAH